MINYFSFLFAIRSLVKNKTYSILNILGFSIGLSCAILLALNIICDLNYDKFHTNLQNLYSVNYWLQTNSDEGYTRSEHSASLGPRLKEEMPEVVGFTRIRYTQYLFKAEDKSFVESGIYADNSLFTLFSFPLLQGDKKKVLSDQNSIVISERMAKKFFKTTSCIGKVLIIKYNEWTESYQISGILKDVPEQSSIKFDFIIPFSKYLAEDNTASELYSNSCTTWLLLRPGSDIKSVSHKMVNLLASNKILQDKNFFFIPLKDKYLFNYIKGKRSFVSSVLDVIIFSAIAILIMLIACFNFMNLGIAFAAKRYNEAGIRKVIGSSPKHILFQFIGESVLLSLISLGIAILIVLWILPAFNEFSPINRELTIPFGNARFMTILLGTVVLTGLLSGLYPGILLSSVNAIEILKRNLSLKAGMNFFRQGLIVFQFAISVLFITCTIIIWKQSQYIQSKDPGINKDNIVFFENHDNISKHQALFKSELLSQPQITSVCYSNSKPLDAVWGSAKVEWTGKDPSSEVIFPVINTDFDYMKTLEPELIQGRFFNPAFASDSGSFVINQTAFNTFKMKNPIGQTIMVDGQRGSIIGVVKDFNINSFFVPYSPVIIRIKPSEAYFTVLKFDGTDRTKVKDAIQKVYSKFEDNYPLDAKFSSDVFYQLNVKDKIAWLTGIFGAIAIFLACLGLFGLTAFMAEKRTKEIGIRKINGAVTSGILMLLLRNYSKWLGIAIFIGLPLAFLLGNSFLNIFAFRIQFPYWALFVGPSIVIAIALLTVGWQTWRAATRNPVESLRYE
jgi:ABC-type antimicrobial peptide transport system permease subunit